MRHVYLGTFAIAAATLALEITLTRLLSLVTWYHLAFFALSSAMLGMTAGAVRVYLRPERFTQARCALESARASLAFALAVPATVFALCLIPAGSTLSVMGLVSLVATTVACAVPFYFAGIALTLVLTRSGLPAGKIYAADLIGAAAGCVVVLFGLELRGAPSVAIWCGGLGALAALIYGARRSLWFKLGSLLLLAGFGTLGFTNSYDRYGIYPTICKGLPQLPSDVLSNGYGRITIIEKEKWSALSRVSVSPVTMAPPGMWAPSPVMPPQPPLAQRDLSIDGGASTTLRRFASPEDIAHQKYDLVNVPYYLRPTGGAAVIGVGGGKDTQSALAFGHKRVTAIDVNPAIISFLTEDFADFAGIAKHPGVKIVLDDARSYLTRTEEKFSIVQMSLIDSWAATQAGAMTLSENALYTVEAWEIFMRRLDEGGIYTVTRFFDPDNLGEAGRMLSLGIATLIRLGVEDPSQHLALATLGRAGTLILSNQPLRDSDRSTLTKVCGELAFDVAIMPGKLPQDPALRGIVEAKTMDALLAVTSNQPLNYDPPTDEDPYFFNLLRLESLGAGFAHTRGMLIGNTMATFVLIGLIGVLLVVTVLTVLVPLILRKRVDGEARARPRVMLAGALYFSAIGAGFMFTEIALIQRLSVFLGHPTYALSVLLFTMILSAGIGSLLSEGMPMTRRLLVMTLALAVACGLLFVSKGLNWVQGMAINEGLTTRILCSILMVSPIGLLLGMFFPAGMRMAANSGASATPWFWALNGVFGVLCSACAVFVSLYLGISTNYLIAAGCYGLLAVAVFGFDRHRGPTVAVEAPDAGWSDPTARPSPE